EFYAYMAFLNVLYTYGMETAYLKFAAEGNELGVFRAVNSLLLLTSIIFSGILVCVATPLVNYLGYPGQEIYIYCTAATLLVDTLLLIPFVRLRLLDQATRFTKLKCWQIGINVVLNVLFLYVFPQIAVGRWMPAWQSTIAHIYNPAHHITYVLLANVLANS